MNQEFSNKMIEITNLGFVPDYYLYLKDLWEEIDTSEQFREHQLRGISWNWGKGNTREYYTWVDKIDNRSEELENAILKALSRVQIDNKINKIKLARLIGKGEL